MASLSKKKPAQVDRFLSDKIIKEFRRADPSFNSEKLLEAIIHHWGGPEKFALDVVSEFKLMGPGTVQRQRLLQMVNHLVMHVSARQEPEHDFALLSDEELLQTATGLVADLNERTANDRTASPPTQEAPPESKAHG